MRDRFGNAHCQLAVYLPREFMGSGRSTADYKETVRGSSVSGKCGVISLVRTSTIAKFLSTGVHSLVSPYPWEVDPSGQTAGCQYQY